MQTIKQIPNRGLQKAMINNVPKAKLAIKPTSTQGMQKAALQATQKPLMSQRDKYAKAMYGASKNGGSNGIGVGN